MKAKFGAYLIIPLKYDGEKIDPETVLAKSEAFPIDTMDLNENVKKMFVREEEQSIGTSYRISSKTLLSRLDPSGICETCNVICGKERYPFRVLDSYLYVFHTKIAFLCLGISFSQMKTLSTICNPGYANNEARFQWMDTSGAYHDFSFDSWLGGLCAEWELQNFYGSASSMLLEAYTYVLALTDTMFSTLEDLRRITFNLHQMQSIEVPVEDDSEEDIRYVYAVKNSALNGYRWGCCVTSQTIAYAVADREQVLDIGGEMNTQAADGLPIVLLALYEKYTCLRFTELLTGAQTKKLKSIQKLKKLMLKFQAYGTVTPANLSRWNNVRQIYAYLLEVCDAQTAVQDISVKIDILVEEQQEFENQRSARIVNLITIFGIVGIMSSVQSIVQILSDGSDLMWSVTLLTTAVMALCFGLAMKK